MNGAGDIALGYSKSSSTLYPSVSMTGRWNGDAPGLMTQGETLLKAGGGSQTHSSGRWGDYSHMSVDPLDDCTFWYTQEYYPSNPTSAGWRTVIASTKLRDCETTTTTPPTAPLGLSAEAGNARVDLAWSASSGSTSYNVKRSTTAGGPYTQIASPSTTMYADTAVVNGTEYFYIVTAVNSGRAHV